jgi:hypothetical protein
LFLQQGGDAPPARPNNFLPHFFVRLLTILPILDRTTWRFHGRVIVQAFFTMTERAPAEALVRETDWPQQRKSAPINGNKRK